MLLPQNQFPLWLSLVLTLFVAQSAAAQTTAELQMMYLSILEKQEMEGWVDSDGDIQFKSEERTYFIEVDEDDPEFFRLVLANIWPIESEMERLKVLKALDIANARVKVAKAFIVRDNVWVSVEGFQGEAGECEAYFARSQEAISLCTKYFAEEMRTE